jgi:hypothetical protein
MPEGGVIFSDGMEVDFLDFGAGVTVDIQPSDQYGQLII